MRSLFWIALAAVALGLFTAEASGRVALSVPEEDTNLPPRHARSLLAPQTSTGDAECNLFSQGCNSQNVYRLPNSTRVVCTDGCQPPDNTTCIKDTYITVVISQTLVFNANGPRYDFVYTTRTAPGVCTAEVENKTDPNPASLFRQLDGDNCLDLNLKPGDPFTRTLQPLTILCNGTNNKVDWEVCFGFTTSSSGANSVCNSPRDAALNPNTPKCKCDRVSLNITILQCSDINCPQWGNNTGGLSWPPGGNANCVDQAGVCKNSNNCDGLPATSGYCQGNLGVSRTLSCFYEFKPVTQVCGAESACYKAANCTGTSQVCPPDEFQTGKVCRESAGCCDPEEVCELGNRDCPDDFKSLAGTICLQTFGPNGTASSCNQTYVCNGTSPLCPYKAVQT